MYRLRLVHSCVASTSSQTPVIISQHVRRFTATGNGDEKPPRRPKKVEDDPSQKYDGAVTGFVNTPMGDSDVDMRMKMTRLRDSMLAQRNVGISAINRYGFRLHDNTMLYGPVAMFPKLALSWKVLTPDDITAESVQFFTLLEPKLDIVLIGVGDKEHIDAVRQRILPVFRKSRIGLEVLKTEDAVPLFNFLNDEHRYVGAGLYPPDVIKLTMLQEWEAHAALTPEHAGNLEWEGMDKHGLALLGLSKDQHQDIVDHEQADGKLPPPNPASRVLRQIGEAGKQTLAVKDQQMKTVEAAKQDRKLLLEQQIELEKLEMAKKRGQLSDKKADAKKKISTGEKRKLSSSSSASRDDGETK